MSNVECIITTTDSGSIKCQIKGDCSPKKAFALMEKELKKAKHDILFWPSLYFGVKKKEWAPRTIMTTKKSVWKATPLPEEEFKSVIEDDDIPWGL